MDFTFLFNKYLDFFYTLVFKQHTDMQFSLLLSFLKWIFTCLSPWVLFYFCILFDHITQFFIQIASVFLYPHRSTFLPKSMIKSCSDTTLTYWKVSARNHGWEILETIIDFDSFSSCPKAPVAGCLIIAFIVISFSKTIPVISKPR